MAESRGITATRLGLAALLGGMSVLHVVQPTPFERMIPDWLPGSPTAWNLAATAAEGTSAALLARRKTAHLGGMAALATFATVWVANLDAIRTGGHPLPGWAGTTQAAIIRAPLQLPLLWASWKVARAGGRTRRHGR